MIKRYNLEHGSMYGDGSFMDVDEDGLWVSYVEHKSFMERITHILDHADSYGGIGDIEIALREVLKDG